MRPYKLFSECNTIDACSGASDTCFEYSCSCGSNAKCTGTTDTCDAGTCRCGENDECSDTQYCYVGECTGTSLIISEFFLILIV